jgi:hypothetical protein
MEKLIILIVFICLCASSYASSSDSIPYGRHAVSTELWGAAGKWGAYYDFTVYRSRSAKFFASIGWGCGLPYFKKNNQRIDYIYVIPHRFILTYRFRQIYCDAGYTGIYSKYQHNEFSGGNIVFRDDKYAHSHYLGLRWESGLRHGFVIRLYWMRLFTEDAPMIQKIIPRDYLSRDWQRSYNWLGLGVGYHF